MSVTFVRLSRMRLIALMAILLIPFLFALLPRVFPSTALIWVFLDALYHLPVTASFGDPFARKTEIREVPTLYGRIAVSLGYSAIEVAIWWMKDKWCSPQRAKT